MALYEMTSNSPLVQALATTFAEDEVLERADLQRALPDDCSQDKED